MDNISNRPVGNFFTGLDVNSYTLIASCVVLGTWFNQRYPDMSVLRDANLDENYFTGFTTAFLNGAHSLVENWQAQYARVDIGQNQIGQRRAAM